MSKTVTGKQALANLINKANGTGYTADTLVHEAPAAFTAAEREQNTKINVWHASKPNDKVEVYYSRLDVEEQYAGLEGGYEVATLAGLLSLINAELDLAVGLEVSDLEPIAEFPTSGTVELIVADTSLNFTGAIEVELGGAAPQARFSAPVTPPPADPEPTTPPADGEGEGDEEEQV